MLSKGKQKLDESYTWLRSTIIQSKQLEALLDKKRDKMKRLQNEAEDLELQISEAKQDLIKHDGLVEEGRGELKHQESIMNQDVEYNNNVVSECEIRLKL